jgi:hypothetical protein
VVKPRKSTTSRYQPWAGLPPGVAEVLRPGIPQLSVEIIDAIRKNVPAYAQPLEGEFGTGVRLGVEQALTEFVDLVETPDRDRSAGREVYIRLGRGEARAGRTMEALLAAYRIGARVAWRRVAEVARGAGLGEEALAALAESIFAYIDELSGLSAEGYAQYQAAAAGEAQRRRRRLVTMMIQSPPPTRRPSRMRPAKQGGDCRPRLPLSSGLLRSGASPLVYPRSQSWRPSMTTAAPWFRTLRHQGVVGRSKVRSEGTWP